MPQLKLNNPTLRFGTEIAAFRAKNTQNDVSISADSRKVFKARGDALDPRLKKS